jgi:hypothetical protein
MEIMVNHFIILKIILYSWLFLCLFVLITYLKMSLIVHPELAFYWGHYAVALYCGIMWWDYVVEFWGGIMRWDHVVALCVGIMCWHLLVCFHLGISCEHLNVAFYYASSWDAEIVCRHFIPPFNDSILHYYIILVSYTGLILTYHKVLSFWAFMLAFYVDISCRYFYCQPLLLAFLDVILACGMVFNVGFLLWHFTLAFHCGIFMITLKANLSW